MSWKAAVNQAVGSAVIADITQYISYSPWSDESPVDRYYSTSRELLSAALPQVLDPHPAIGPLLLVGIVSATENYFRELLARLVRLCPLAQASSADQAIKLGSVIWHSGVQVERGAFEHFSFADSDSIKKACRNFLDAEVKVNSPTSVVLGEFDRVCELRHGIVHSNAILAGKNAIRLQIGRTAQSVGVRVAYPQLQEAALVCTSLVTTFNTEMFVVMAGRWASDWRKQASWDFRNERRLFGEIWKIFFSETDKSVGSIPHSFSVVQCRKAVRKEFNLI